MKRVTMAALVVLALFLSAATAVQAADVTGNWKSTFETPRGTMERTFVFKQDGNKLTGKIITPRGEAEIKDGKVSGDEIEFSVEQQRPGGEKVVVPYKAKVSGDEMKGTFTGPGGQTREWSAKREK